MMKTFLQEVAENIYKDHPKLDEVTVVFPNRRASIYFRKYLSGLITKPAFAPRILTIEEFFAEFSHLKVPEKIMLVSILFKAYAAVVTAAPEEPDAENITQLEDFYFW